MLNQCQFERTDAAAATDGAAGAKRDGAAVQRRVRAVAGRGQPVRAAARGDEGVRHGDAAGELRRRRCWRGTRSASSSSARCGRPAVLARRRCRRPRGGRWPSKLTSHANADVRPWTVDAAGTVACARALGAVFFSRGCGRCWTGGRRRRPRPPPTHASRARSAAAANTIHQLTTRFAAARAALAASPLHLEEARRVNHRLATIAGLAAAHGLEVRDQQPAAAPATVTTRCSRSTSTAAGRTATAPVPPRPARGAAGYGRGQVRTPGEPGAGDRAGVVHARPAVVRGGTRATRRPPSPCRHPRGRTRTDQQACEAFA